MNNKQKIFWILGITVIVFGLALTFFNKKLDTVQTGEQTREDIISKNENKYPWQFYRKPSDEELKNTLTETEFEITQNDGTETPFKNEYDSHKEVGIYVDILSGEPLYSSKDKFDSGTGWPSFVKPITPNAVVLIEDNTLFVARTEIRSVYSDSHIGHVFNDGPSDSGGKRYCMNSVALRFVPMEQMESEGYSDFLQYI